MLALWDDHPASGRSWAGGAVLRDPMPGPRLARSRPRPMTEEAGRPQDQGRSHKRKGAPSAATRTLLVEYQEAMRAELRAVLGDLAPRVPPAGLLPDVQAVPIRLPMAERIKAWDLAIKLGRELGTEIEPAAPPVAASRPARRPRKVDFG